MAGSHAPEKLKMEGPFSLSRPTASEARSALTRMESRVRPLPLSSFCSAKSVKVGFRNRERVAHATEILKKEGHNKHKFHSMGFPSAGLENWELVHYGDQDGETPGSSARKTGLNGQGYTMGMKASV